MTEALIPVRDSVWLYPTDGGNRIEPNVGIIATARQTVLVDSGNSPRHALQIRTAIEMAGLPPVSYIVLTHHHWDHVFGSQVFHAPVIAQQLCAESLTERAARPWSSAYLEEEARKNPPWEAVYRRMQSAVVDWTDFRIVTPSIVFTRDLTLHLDGLTMQITHVGGKHASDSSIVIVPEAQVAFVGDSFYPSVQRPITDKQPDEAIIQRLLAYEDVALFVDGHTSGPITREALAQPPQDADTSTDEEAS